MNRGLIMPFFKKHLPSYAMAVMSIGIAKAIQVQIPNIIGNFINRFRSGITVSDIESYALELAAVAIGYVLLFGLGQYTVGKNARIFEGNLRRRLFSHWETLESHYFERHTVGDLLSHVLNDVPAVRQALAGGISQILQAVFLLIATLFMTVTKVNLELTVVSLVPLILIPVVVVRLGPKIKKQSRLVQESLSQMSDMAEESLQSIRLIKSTANESVELRRFSEKTDLIYDRSMRQVRLNTMFQALIPLLTGISFAIALVFGGYLTLQHTITLGAFVAFTVYLSMLVRPLMQFGNVINIFQNSSASLARIETLLQAAPSILDPDTPASVPDEAPIRIRNLTFTYPRANSPVLRNICLTIEPGMTLGVVGRTGSGKSTLCGILLREIDPPPGTVFLGDTDIRDVHRQELREQISYVPQDGFLFSTSIGNNIAFPLDLAESGLETITDAASKAHILGAIRSMPEQFSTVVGERGINLSGGQRQRVAIARALIKTHAKILIFDDSLSAVDTVTEAAILETLGELRRQGRTLILVSHRLSSLRHADRIVVLDQGRVVEYGTPTELLENPGLYASLYALQSEGGTRIG